jgi:hypothetical protein
MAWNDLQYLHLYLLFFHFHNTMHTSKFPINSSWIMWDSSPIVNTWIHLLFIHLSSPFISQVEYLIWENLVPYSLCPMPRPYYICVCCIPYDLYLITQDLDNLFLMVMLKTYSTMYHMQFIQIYSWKLNKNT